MWGKRREVESKRRGKERRTNKMVVLLIIYT
jgi:hypothetical protein